MVWSHNDIWMVTGDHGGYIKYWQSNMNNVKMFQAHKEAIRGIRYWNQNQTKIKIKFHCCDTYNLRTFPNLFFYKCSLPNNTSTLESKREKKKKILHTKNNWSVIDATEENKRDFFFNPLYDFEVKHFIRFVYETLRTRYCLIAIGVYEIEILVGTYG